jgi:hypothetical protein
VYVFVERRLCTAAYESVPVFLLARPMLPLAFVLSAVVSELFRYRL